MMKLIGQGLQRLAQHTKCGRRILKGIRRGKCDVQFKFQGLESGNSKMLDIYEASFPEKAPGAIKNILDDRSFQSIVEKYLKKNKITEGIPSSLTQEEITMFMLQKGGVGPSKFAQIISSDVDMMSKFPPDIQEVIKKTQSENPFSRTLTEAQDIVNKAFTKKTKTYRRN